MTRFQASWSASATVPISDKISARRKRCPSAFLQRDSSARSGEEAAIDQRSAATSAARAAAETGFGVLSSGAKTETRCSSNDQRGPTRCPGRAASFASRGRHPIPVRLGQASPHPCADRRSPVRDALGPRGDSAGTPPNERAAPTKGSSRGKRYSRCVRISATANFAPGCFAALRNAWSVRSSSDEARAIASEMRRDDAGIRGVPAAKRSSNARWVRGTGACSSRANASSTTRRVTVAANA